MGSSQAGSSSSVGGSSGAGVVSNAGAAGITGGAGAPAVACASDANLVNATGCFVGCDPTLSTDNPDGIQGAFYTFGDGSSCTPVNPPCAATGICLSGATVVDSTYAKWGCGIGLELNATGGTTSVKQAYAGTASCYKYTLTGSSGGNEVRLSFTQTADTTGRVSPYLSLKPFTNGATGTICTKDVTCPTPAPTPPNCALTGMEYDLQINVVGGNQAGNYNLCLTDLEPVTDGTSTLAQLCGAQGSTNATEAVGKYFAQNNVNAGDGSLCMTPALNGTAASFQVDSATFTNGTNALAAYPSIVDGWHYGHTSTDAALPKLVSSLTSVNSSVAYTGSNGKYDASYDIWVLPDNTNPTTPAGGLEVMMWLNDAGVNPAGSNANMPSYMGWEVWSGTVGTWKYVAYRKTGQSSFTGDLAPFIKNAVTVANLQGTPYLAGIEFGFELYDASGAQGFKVTSFSSDVQ